MGLSFLVPAFLAGLALLAVPIVIHLTRRQRSRVIEFPSLMFLERIPYRSMRRRKIRHWMLLMVRAAALGLLIVAFARPLFTDVDLAAGTVLGPREVVVLLDRSYSMSYGDRWQDAVESARGVLTSLEPQDRASLIFFDASAAAPNRSTSEVDRLLRSLDEAAVGSRGTRYGPALKLAESILADSNLPNKELILISDFQRAGWNGEEDARFGGTVRVIPMPVAGEATDEVPENAAVVDLDLRRDAFSGRERVTVAGRITRTGGTEARTVAVTLAIDGREMETREVALEPDDATVVAFEPFTLPGSFTRGEVSLPADELTPDDARRFVLSNLPGASILLVRESSPGGRSSLYLERALSVAGSSGYRVDVRSPAALGAELSERSVVIVSDVALAGSSAENLARFVSDGGGLLLISGEATRVPQAAADLLPAQISTPVDRSDPGRLGFIDYSHPILEPFAGPDGGDFSRARFYRYRGLVPSDSARILARFDDGTPAIIEGRQGRGRTIVWASSADNFWNDLVLQPLFLPLLHQTVDYLTGHAPVPDSYVAGDVLDLSDPEALGLRGSRDLPTGAQVDGERVALLPSGGSAPVPQSERPFLDLAEHGFYEIRAPGSDEARPVTVGVNVDVAESDLRIMDPEELVLAIQATTVADGETESIEGSGVLRIEALERRQSLWRFLLVGAFVLLVLETVMSNRLSRKPAVGVGGGRA